MDAENIVQFQRSKADLLNDLDRLTKTFPVGSCWIKDNKFHKVKSIQLGESLATVTTLCIDNSFEKQSRFPEDKTNTDNPTDFYSVNIFNSFLCVSDIESSVSVDLSEFIKIYALAINAVQAKMAEIYDKSCLFYMTSEPVETYTDFNKMYSEEKGIFYFFYEPADNIFRVFALDITKFEGKITVINEDHFAIDNQSGDKIFMLAANSSVELTSVFNGKGMYQITEFQYKNLRDMIQNCPIKSEE